MLFIIFSDRDATQLLHAYTFINDLYTDNNLRNFVLTYPNFTSALQESIPVCVNEYFFLFF